MTHDDFRSPLHERRIAICLAVVGLLVGGCVSSSQDGSNTSDSSSPEQVTYTPPLAPPGLGIP